MSVTVPFQQPERRRAARTALHLNATMRDGNRKAEARVIDMSSHGCRIACSTVVADDSWVWLNLPGLEGQRAEWRGIARSSWAWVQTPLNEAVFEAAGRAHARSRPRRSRELQHRQPDSLAGAARRAMRTSPSSRISRQCAENAVVEGLKLKAPKGLSAQRPWRLRRPARQYRPPVADPFEQGTARQLFRSAQARIFSHWPSVAGRPARRTPAWPPGPSARAAGS
jgi:hypothetical protein